MGSDMPVFTGEVVVFAGDRYPIWEEGGRRYTLDRRWIDCQECGRMTQCDLFHSKDGKRVCPFCRYPSDDYPPPDNPAQIVGGVGQVEAMNGDSTGTTAKAP